MASELRVVIDTSVVVSAVLLARSVPRRALDRVLERGKLLISAATVKELNEVVRRPCFDPYVREDQRQEFLARLIREAEVVEVGDVVLDCRDPRDNKFLELALSGRATCIISGDRDLLVLDPFRGIGVITARIFLERWPGRD
jgi:hypothetical protein